MMMMGNMRKSTPGETLELLSETKPVHLQIEEQALKTNNRLKQHHANDWDGLSKGKKKGHILKAKEREESLDLPLGQHDR